MYNITHYQFIHALETAGVAQERDHIPRPQLCSSIHRRYEMNIHNFVNSSFYKILSQINKQIWKT